MKWFALSILCFSQLAFANPIDNVRLATTATFYNENFQTAGALVTFVTSKNKTKGDELAAYMSAKKIELTAKMPRLLLVNDHLEVEGYKGTPFSMIPNANGGMKLNFENYSSNVNVTMTLLDIQNAFIQSEKSKNIRETMINMIFPVAEADDAGSMAALVVGSYGVDLTSVVYGSTYAGEEAEFSIRKKIRNFLHGRTRDNATEACEKIQEGKTVKNTEKLIASLQSVKKEIDCIQWWPATSVGSCGWYDAKITCLQEIQGPKGDNSSRGAKKESTPVESGSSSSNTKSKPTRSQIK